MYFAKDFKIKAAHKFEFGCGFYFCVIGVLKYIIGICYYAGFNNVPYFNRVFKSNKGVSPGEYSRS